MIFFIPLFKHLCLLAPESFHSDGMLYRPAASLVGNWHGNVADEQHEIISWYTKKISFKTIRKWLIITLFLKMDCCTVSIHRDWYLLWVARKQLSSVTTPGLENQWIY